MSASPWPKKKIAFLLSIIGVYAIIGLTFIALVSAGVLHRSAPTLFSAQGSDTLEEISSSSLLPHITNAQQFLEAQLMNDNGHIHLYVTIGTNGSSEDNNTNSEAASYYLLWSAQQGDKERFDTELQFVQLHMIQPTAKYMMWRLTENDTAVGDGENIATDADLRTIKALFIANGKWPSLTYTRMIDQLASSIEKVAITSDGYLAPYGGVSGGESTWTAHEVWLSYSDFSVFRGLSQRRGAPWTELYTTMKNATLNAQLENGLYNSVLTEQRAYGNSIDAGSYSINSLWMMVRAAESGDADLMRSANKSLQFYKANFKKDGELYASYGSNGDALSPSDTPWVYALVGRAAANLNDKEFTQALLHKLLEYQNTQENTTLYGSFAENYGPGIRVGQFTMQESILTLQAIYSMPQN